METYVNTVLRPLLQGDGGEIEFIAFDGVTLRVRLSGECSFCAKSALCIEWCAEKIKKDLGKTVKIVAEKKKPYFRDT